ncbi:MAG: hypothetical protein ABFS08_08700 [Pseudomonadota bacterium]
MDTKIFNKRVTTVLASSLFALVAGCSGGGGDSAVVLLPPPPPPPPCVAVFANDTYVDYIVGNSDSEASNMEAILAADGYDARTFTGITAADFTAATDGCVALVIPEQENGSLAADIGAPEHTAISDYVNAGGNLIVGFANANSTTLVNDIFGLAITSIADSGAIAIVDNDAIGTPFEGGTTVGGTALTAPSATNAFTAADLPLGSRVIYADANGNAVVAMGQVGSGTVTLLGWDYFNALPVGAVDDGWLEVLTQAVSADALEMQIPLTDVALADVEAQGWTTCFTETYNITGTSIPDTLAACAGTELMMACRETATPGTLTLAAWATEADMTVDTNAANDGVTNDVAGVSWYYNSTYSWGFASLGDTVVKSSCDVDNTGKNNQRLCWHADPGDVLQGGFRCGTTTGLNDSTAWERVLLKR